MLLFNAPSIHPGFLGNLRLVAGLLGRRRLVLHRRAPLVLLVLLRSSPRLLPLLASLVRRERTARVRLPFPRPLEAPATPEVKEKAPERSQPDGTSLPLRVGSCLAPHWRRWQAIGVESWVVTVLWDGYPVPFKDSPPPLSRTQVLFPTYRAGSPRDQALRQEVKAMLAKGALEIALDPSLPGGEGVWRLASCDRPLSPEQVRPAYSVEDGNSRFCTVICQRGVFLASLDLKDA